MKFTIVCDAVFSDKLHINRCVWMHLTDDCADSAVVYVNIHLVPVVVMNREARDLCMGLRIGLNVFKAQRSIGETVRKLVIKARWEWWR